MSGVIFYFKITDLKINTKLFCTRSKRNKLKRAFAGRDTEKSVASLFYEERRFKILPSKIDTKLDVEKNQSNIFLILSNSRDV